MNKSKILKIASIGSFFLGLILIIAGVTIGWSQWSELGNSDAWADISNHTHMLVGLILWVVGTILSLAMIIIGNIIFFKNDGKKRLKDTNEKFMNSTNELLNKVHSKYRGLKDSINKEVGKKVFTVLNILVITIFLLVIPIVFTVMTTLLVSAGGPISLLTYRITFYCVWILLILIFIARMFFAEYRK